MTDGFLGNLVEECKMESSAYEWIVLDVIEKIFIKIRNKVDDRTHSCWISLLIDWSGESDPFTIKEMDLFDEKSSRKEQVEYRKP